MLLDTSGLMSLLDAREPFHQRACEEYARATLRVTHAYVLVELVALANSRRVPPATSLNFLTNVLGDGDINTIWPDGRLSTRAIALLMARQGRGYSLCDAVSFVIMRDRNIGEALTSDRHFETEGFRRLLV